MELQENKFYETINGTIVANLVSFRYGLWAKKDELFNILMEGIPIDSALIMSMMNYVWKTDGTCIKSREHIESDMAIKGTMQFRVDMNWNEARKTFRAFTGCGLTEAAANIQNITKMVFRWHKEVTANEVTDLDRKEFTLKEKAAIMLKSPNSGTPWLDKMILESTKEW